MKKLLFSVCVTLAIYGCSGLIAGNEGDLPPLGGSGYSSSNRPSSSSRAIVYGTSVNYQGKTYQTVVIGTQTWFARNLNYSVEGSVCYNNQTSYCDTYGRLYNWETALTVCPTGWHLPTQAEWNTLTSFIQMDKSCTSCDAKHLKSTDGWYNSGNGLDSYGFAALPGGIGDPSGSFYLVGNYGDWWSASEKYANYAYYRYMYYYNEGAGWGNNDNSVLRSVRCVRD